MKHFYEGIHGWFDFQEIYSDIVKRAPAKAHFVEVGSWIGRSTAFLAVEIVNSGKNIRLDAVDTFEGNIDFGGEDRQLLNRHAGNVKEVFLKNMAPVAFVVNTVNARSTDAAQQYTDESLDFVFIDANHDYANVSADIQSWWPKLKFGGTMAGHDYGLDRNDVARAVDDFFGAIEFVGSSWRVRKLRTALGLTFYNERKWLELHMPVITAAKRIDGIVGVDCSSADGSAEAFRQFTSHVFPYTPVNDYSDQFNRLLFHCKQLGFEALLRLDPDELMFPDDMDCVVATLRAGRPFLTLPRYNFEEDRQHYETYSYPDYQGRAFHLHPELRYDNRMHETVTASASRLGWSAKPVENAHIYHYARIVDPIQTYLFHENGARRIKGVPLCTPEEVPEHARHHQARELFLKGPQPLDPLVIGVRAPLE